MSTTTPIFQVGGLASGLDTNSIVQKLVALESQPITANQTKQAALTTQISAIGDLSSKIQALASATSTLGSGVAVNSASTVPAGITATTGTGAVAGSYAITVSSVASSAKARSTGFSSPNNTVAGGVLEMHVQGVDQQINIAANSDLGSVVSQINSAGAGVSAAVVSDGTNFYVSLTNLATGKPIGSGANGGLTVDSDATGLGMAVTQNATNALVKVDDLNVESQTNSISTAIPGVTITANSIQPTGTLIISSDSTTSTSNIQSFVNAYNAIVADLKPSLQPDPNNPAPAGSTIDGSIVLSLQQRLQGLLSTQVSSNGPVQTLADLGVSLQNDGTLSLDTTQFNKALTADPGAVNSLFSTASTGLAAKVSQLSTDYTDPFAGQLVQRTTSLNETITDLTNANTQLQAHVTAYQQQLETAFTNMENTIASYNTIGQFLSAESGGSTSSSSSTAK